MNQSISDAPFNRTTCACSNCVRCCKDQPGSLVPNDIHRILLFISKTQGLSREDAVSVFKKQFVASPGALVKDSATGRTFRIGTITPRRKGSRCVFLDENDRCKIHSVAPFGCSHFDTHMSRSAALPRSMWMAEQQQQSVEYQALRNELPYSQSYKPKAY